ncbi:hypothetical protein STEG23_013438, partial [Scotinomys teguina]
TFIQYLMEANAEIHNQELGQAPGVQLKREWSDYMSQGSQDHDWKENPGNWTGEFDNLMDQLRVAIVTVNSTWVNAGLVEGLSSWISAEMNHLKEWESSPSANAIKIKSSFETIADDKNTLEDKRWEIGEYEEQIGGELEWETKEINSMTNKGTVRVWKHRVIEEFPTVHKEDNTVYC